MWQVTFLSLFFWNSCQTKRSDFHPPVWCFQNRWQLQRVVKTSPKPRTTGGGTKIWGVESRQQKKGYPLATWRILEGVSLYGKPHFFMFGTSLLNKKRHHIWKKINSINHDGKKNPVIMAFGAKGKHLYIWTNKSWTNHFDLQSFLVVQPMGATGWGLRFEWFEATEVHPEKPRSGLVGDVIYWRGIF